MNAAVKIDEMPVGVKETLWCLWARGPTWDGHVPSKYDRTWLVEHGYADRGDGWNWLTTAGCLLALELGYGAEKDRWERERRALRR